MRRLEPIINIPRGEIFEGGPLLIFFATFKYEFAITAKITMEIMPILFAIFGTIPTNASYAQ